MKRFLLSCGLALLALPALAGRPFPADALRGKMTLGYFPDLTMNGKARRFSPGARIFTEDNLSQVPASLGSSEFVVNYTVDGMGQINRVWILTQEEAAQTLPTEAPAPSTQIVITTTKQ
jgi:hypothetical protein